MAIIKSRPRRNIIKFRTFEDLIYWSFKGIFLITQFPQQLKQPQNSLLDTTSVLQIHLSAIINKYSKRSTDTLVSILVMDNMTAPEIQSQDIHLYNWQQYGADDRVDRSFKGSLR